MVAFDCATSGWIHVASGVQQGSVLGPLLFVLYTSNTFDLYENKVFAYADDSPGLSCTFR